MIHINQQTVGDIALLTVAGRLDGINAPQFKQAIQSQLDNGQTAIVLNLSGVDYLSAAALRVLKQLNERTGRVCIAAPSNRVVEVMQITGLDAVYELYNTQTQAMHATHPIVNAHTHLELGWLADGVPPLRGMPFATWLDQAIRQPLEQMRVGWEKRMIAAAEAGVQALVNAGVTTVGDISSTGLSIEPLMNAGLHGIVYIEVLGRTPVQASNSLLRAQELIDNWRPKMHGGLQLGLSIHAPYTASRELFTKALAYARAAELPLCIHVAESADEMEYMQSGTGALADYVEDAHAEGMTPVEFLADVGALELQPLLIHMVHVTDDDIQRVKDAGCTVVHCPRSNLRLQCGRMPLEKYLAAEVPVLLGTDSLASAPSLNIFDELEIAVALHHEHVPPKRVVPLIHGTLPGMSE